MRKSFKVRYDSECDPGCFGETVFYFKDTETNEIYQWWTKLYKYFDKDKIYTFNANVYKVENETFAYLKNVRSIKILKEESK